MTNWCLPRYYTIVMLSWHYRNVDFLLNFGPDNFLTYNLHNCPGKNLTQSLHSAFFCLCVQFGDSSYYLKALNSMDNGAEVKVKEFTNWNNKDFTVLQQNGKESVCPKEQHKQSRGSPDRDGDNDNEFQHFLKSPFFFLYI